MEQQSLAYDKDKKRKKILKACAITGSLAVMVGTGIGIGYLIWYRAPIRYPKVNIKQSYSLSDIDLYHENLTKMFIHFDGAVRNIYVLSGILTYIESSSVQLDYIPHYPLNASSYFDTTQMPAKEVYGWEANSIHFTGWSGADDSDLLRDFSKLFTDQGSIKFRYFLTFSEYPSFSYTKTWSLVGDLEFNFTGVFKS